METYTTEEVIAIFDQAEEMLKEEGNEEEVRKLMLSKFKTDEMTDKEAIDRAAEVFKHVQEMESKEAANDSPDLPSTGDLDDSGEKQEETTVTE